MERTLFTWTLVAVWQHTLLQYNVVNDDVSDKCIPFCNLKPCLNKHNIENVLCFSTMTLTLNTQSFNKILWLMIMYDRTESGCKRIRRYSRSSHILIILTLTVTLSLKIANQSLRVTLELMRIDHHIKFGCKRFSGSEDVFWVNNL